MDPAFELAGTAAADAGRRGVQAAPGVQDNIARLPRAHRADPACSVARQAIHHPPSWPVVNRERVTQARAGLLSALFDQEPPTPPTAAIISLLHAVDGLGALLSLNDRGWRWVHMRASEIASGGWVDEYETALPEMNLAVTASAVRPALT